MVSMRLTTLWIFKSVGTYSIPLIPNNLAWWVVNASDRTIIAHFLTTAANGIYSVANKFPNVFISFYNILNLSWTETVSLHYGDEDRDEFLTETMTSLFKLFAAACFGIVACMPFVFPIMVNLKYSAAYNQILILMYAMLFRVLVGLYSCVYATTERKTDMTIGDFWHIEETIPDFYDEKGNSIFLIHTDRGEQLFETVKVKLEYRLSDTKQCWQANLEAPTKRSEQRDEFWNDYQRKGVDFVMKKYGTTPLKTKIKNKIVKLISIGGGQTLNPDLIYYADYSERRAA